MTLAILAPTILEFGTEEQKQRHLPAMLKGEEFWAQLLSEPTGGSTSPVRRPGPIATVTSGSSTARRSGARVPPAGSRHVPARTDWDVPKHKGLTMFALDLHQPGVEINPIRLVSGSSDFCQEFFTDVVLTDAQVVGEVTRAGWSPPGS